MKNFIGNTIILAVFILFIGNIIHGNMPASAESIQDAVSVAEKTEDGKILSSDFFKKYSAPTNNEVYALKKLSNEIIVRDIARQKTGDNTIKTNTEIESDKPSIFNHETMSFWNTQPIPSLDVSYFQLFIIVLFVTLIYVGFLKFVSNKE